MCLHLVVRPLSSSALSTRHARASATWGKNPVAIARTSTQTEVTRLTHHIVSAVEVMCYCHVFSQIGVHEDRSCGTVVSAKHAACISASSNTALRDTVLHSVIPFFGPICSQYHIQLYRILKCPPVPLERRRHFSHILKFCRPHSPVVLK